MEAGTFCMVKYKVMQQSTPDIDYGNWYRFSEQDTTPEWEKDDTDEVEEDSYDEDSDPYEE